MFFILSKALWVLSSPSDLLTAMLVLGCLLLLTKRAALGRKLVLGATFFLLICTLFPVSTPLYRVIEDRFPSPVLPEEAPTGIIVLGGAIDQVISASRGKVSLNDAAGRLIEAVVLARRYPTARLVYTGGSNSLLPQIGSESEDAKRLWVDLGIDPARITLEDQSRNTFENARFTRDLLHPRPEDRWLLVTSAYHMPRAMGLFRAAGFPVTAVPVAYLTSGTWRGLEPNRDTGGSLARLDFITHEWIGLVVYWLSGKIDSPLPGP